MSSQTLPFAKHRVRTMQLQPNTLLQGRYRIRALIAQGGMGAVYQATDERLGNTVALKQTLMRDPALRAAFEREARLLAGLAHPALPVVSDHFAEDDGQFLVMQFVPGADLATLLQQHGGPFSLTEVWPWAESLLDALEYLHQRQPPVIHRDIKPQNLKLASHGGVVLLDFGLAKGQLSSTPDATSPSLFGYTPQYAPLEQIQGSGTDARSDLYAVAATLYDLLTASPPATALARVAAAVRNEPDPLIAADTLNPQLPPTLAAALARGLSLNPALRPPSASAMRAELRAAFQDAPAAAAQADPERPPLSSAGKTTLHVAAPAPPVSLTLPAPATPTPLKLPSSAQRWAPLAYVGVLLLLLCVAAGPLLAFVLWSETDPVTAPPVIVPAPVDAAPPTDANAPAPADAAPPADADAVGLSRATPLPLGATVVIDGWQVEVLEQVRGEAAYEQVRKANQNNRPPAEGMEYLLLHFRVTSTAPEPQWIISDLRVIGARGEAYAITATVAPEPDFERSGQVSRGEVRSGWVVYQIGVEERDLLLGVGRLGGDAYRFVALTAEASLRPDPALAELRPDRLGQDWREPIALGQEVVTDDWVLSISEVLRGEPAWERIIAHNRFNDPPPDGMEYALAFVEVRFIGDNDEPNLIYESYFIGSEGPEAVEQPSVVDPEPNLHALLFPGGASSGWVVVTVVAGSADARLVFKHSTVGFEPDNFNTRFFALP